MLPGYEDIRAMETSPPLWWDDHGVPRYAPFDPMMLGVYDRFALLVEIECQACPEKFLVGCGWSSPHWVGTEFEIVTWEKLRPLQFHFGDPPRHACVGDTMNCVDLRVVEAWDCTSMDWVRVPVYEGEITGWDDEPAAVSTEPHKETP